MYSIKIRLGLLLLLGESLNIDDIYVTLVKGQVIPFGMEGRMWDVIVLIPDHCISI